MHGKHLLFLIVSLLFYVTSLLPVVAQNTDNSLDVLKENIGDVTIKDDLYKQSFQIKNGSCIVSFKIANTDKNDETEYECNLSDLNEFKIELNATKQSLKIECETRGKKDVVRVYENGKIKRYTNSFVFYAKDVDNGKLIVQELKIQVKACNENQKDLTTILGNSPNIDNAIEFLKTNVKPVVVNEKTLEQTFSVENDFKPLCTFEIVDGSEEKSTKFSFNAGDINPSTVDFETKNEFVYVEGQTKGNNKLISVFENGEKENYTNRFYFYVDDIEQGRKLKNVLEMYVTKSENVKSAEFDKLNNLTTLPALNDFLSSKLNGETNGNSSYKQSFSYDKSKPYLCTFTFTNDEKNETESNTVNLIDLNKTTANFSVSGSTVKIDLETSGKLDLIGVEVNGERDKYTDEITIYATGIEDARILVETLKSMITKASEVYKPNFVQGVDNPTKAQCVKFLNESFTKVVEGDDAYELELNPDAENSCKLAYKVHDVSKDKTYEYKFDLADVIAEKINFNTHNEEANIHLEIKGGKKFIETLEQGESKEYVSRLDLKASDIESARLICEALKKLSAHCNNDSK